MRAKNSHRGATHEWMKDYMLAKPIYDEYRSHGTNPWV